MRGILDLIDRNLSFSRLGDFIRMDKRTKKNPLITISRAKGSGGSHIADLVARRLGKPWELYHKDIIEQISKESHTERELIKQIDESRASLIEEFVADFFGRRYLNLSGYYKHLIRVLSVIGHRGHAVIVGRGANFLFPNALRVRIVADLPYRIGVLTTYEKMSEKTARKKIEESDRNRKDFAKTLFQHDHTQAQHFDIVLNIGDNLSMNQAANIIVYAARKKFKL